MQVIRTTSEVRTQVRTWRNQGFTIGLVPTMGALHEGHLSLVDAALKGCGRVLTTLFVNPLQFGPSEDYSIYPREEAGDRSKLEARQCHALFAPTIEEMFPDPESSPKAFKTMVRVRELTESLCGGFRPGHFEGVTTLVTRLFMIGQPDFAYFGEKDFQQLQVIRRMVRDLNIPVEVAGCPTVRENDGLALSSRNQYLSPEHRRIAPLLYGALHSIAEQLRPGMPCAPAIEAAQASLLAAGFTKVDYITAAHSETLRPIERVWPPARVFAAAWLGRTRLIDNVPFNIQT